MAMIHTIETLEIRKDRLEKKDPVGNARIIAKLERKIRQLEQKNLSNKIHLSESYRKIYI